MPHKLKVIQRFIKTKFDRIKNPKIQDFVMQNVPLWIASCIVGLLSVLYAEVIHWGEKTFVAVYLKYRWSVFIISPVFFFLAYALVNNSAKFAGGSGIPQVMAVLRLPNRTSHKFLKSLLGFRVIVVKILSSLLMVLGGGVVGREGPTIQISASILYLFNKIIPDSWPKVSEKIMYATGAAAGLAAAFNTPLGGIVFAIEDLTQNHIRYLRTTVFATVIIAGFTAQTILGPYLVFGYPKLAVMDFMMFLYIVLTAVIVGIVGTFFAKSAYAINRRRKRLKPKQQFLWGFVAVMLFSTVVYFTNENTVGGGSALLDRLLFTSDKNIELRDVAGRLFNGLISFTNGGSGGVFAPSLSFGGAIGAYIGQFLELKPTEINLLVIIGMVGLLTSFTRSPFTSAILVFEMTDRHSVIFQIMMAALIAYAVGYFIDKKSFYEKTTDDIVHEIEKKKKLMDENKSLND